MEKAIDALSGVPVMSGYNAKPASGMSLGKTNVTESK